MTPRATTEDAPHQDQLEKLARRGTASVVGAGFSAVSSVILVVLVTNGFSATVAGTLFAATAAFLILESAVLLGTDTGLVRWLPSHLASGRASDVPRTLVIAAAPVLLLSLAGTATLYLTAPTLAVHLAGPEAASVMATMLRALALVLPVAALHDLVLAATRGLGSMRPTVVVENLGRHGLQSLAVLVVYLAGTGPLALALAWSLPYVVALAWAGWSLRGRMVPADLSSDRPGSWVDLAVEFWSYTVPRALARITQTALKRSDIVLVAALASPADAALYTAATRFIVLGQLLVQSVQQALSPHLSTLFAQGKTTSATSVFQAATLWSMLVAWPIYLVTASFATPLMGVFGAGYDVASDVVVVLSLTMLLATACGPVDTVLLMAGRSWLSLRNSSVALAVNLALNVILIPVHGIRGAAVAWSVAILVRNLLPLVQVRRQLGMWPVTGPTLLVASGAVGCFGTAGVIGVAAGLPARVEAVLLLTAVVVYLAGVRTYRERFGLGAFRTALSRSGIRRSGDRPACPGTP